MPIPVSLANTHALIPFAIIHILFNHAHHAVYDHAYPVPLGNLPILFPFATITMDVIKPIA